MDKKRSTTRWLAWGALAGQAAFVVAWVAAGALEPGYSHVEQGVSELGARNASNPWIEAAGMALLGLSLLLLGAALVRVLPPRPAARVAAVLFATTGLALALAAAFPLDCGLTVDQGCIDRWEAGSLSWRHDAHLWASLASRVLLLGTPFAIARALWPGPAGAMALSAGVAGLGIAAAGTLGYLADTGAAGLVERLEFAVLHAWALIVAVGILHSARRAPARSELIGLRPRDFLAREWTGDGRLVLRPFFLGRRMAHRFEARRECTWFSDRLWRIDDEARYGDGRADRRHMYCELVSDDHVRLTAADLPDGADVWLEEGGYRMSAFRMAFPIGPLPVLVRLHDRSHVAEDGTFVNTFDICTVGLRIPVARVTFRVSPVDETLPAFDRPREESMS